MTNSRIHILSAFGVLLALGAGMTPALAQRADSARFAEIVGRMTEWVNQQQYDSLQARYSPDLQKTLSLPKTKILIQRLTEKGGKILRHGAPRIVSSRQANVTLALERGVQELQLYLDAEGRITSYILISKSEEPPTESFLDSLAGKPAVAVAAVAPPVKDSPPAPSIAAAQIPVSATPAPVPAKAEPAPAPKAEPAVQTPVESKQPLPVSLPPPTTVNPGSPAVAPPPPVSEKPRTPSADPAISPAAPAAAEPAPAVRDKQATPLYPPFKGDWLVIAGGQDVGESVRRTLLTEQYAYEFAAHKNNDRYHGAGTKCEDYYAFGQDVLAPAAGTVVEAIDGVPDNDPGSRNPYALIGNAVVIRHSDREYSVVAFLKRGSVKVRVGDAVQRGQVIGQCGSSGAATEPSLHFHLQNSSRWSTASTVKFYFEQVGFSSGEEISVRRDVSPVAGDRLRSE
jgi:murein DD-endopeptidase MepM/ murein hydrolase activator NlpD